MMDLHLSSTSLIFCIIFPLLLLILPKLRIIFKHNPASTPTKLPKSYPIVGSFFTVLKNRGRYVQWASEIVTSTPNLTFTLRRNFGLRNVITANPDNVQHILKSHFSNYIKGDIFTSTLRDFLGGGIFNADGQQWKFQRQVASHEFNTRSLRKFVEHVVDYELSHRLIPILKSAAADRTVLDFQDILQRFGFDNVCKIAFGFDPGYLSPSLPEEILAVAFEKALKLSSQRFGSFIPLFWKIKRALSIGSEKELKNAVKQVRESAKEIMRKKKQEIQGKDHPVDDLLSRFLSSGHSDEDFVTDIMISFILAGKDTTSAALTWFFWLLSSHPEVENQIMREIKEGSSDATAYDEVKDMVYTHASLCESMRLYPPVPTDGREAQSDDVLPDGTTVKKGMRVSYHSYAMGRAEKLWGKDCAEFRPERWLERDAAAGKWNFVNRDPYTYPVFHAGPRVCLGKEMAFMQMKGLVAGILRQFRVVPVEGAEPVYVSNLTAKMKGGFPVRIEPRY